MGIHNIEELFPMGKKKVNADQASLDLAPDADEKGDDLPDQVKDLVHDGDVEPDNVDKREVSR